MKNPTPLVQMAAFVMPVFDYAINHRRNCFRYIPTEADTQVGLQVWGWDLSRERWVFVGWFELEHEADEAARAWHEKVMERAGAYPYCPKAYWTNEEFQEVVAEMQQIDDEESDELVS